MWPNNNSNHRKIKSKKREKNNGISLIYLLNNLFVSKSQFTVLFLFPFDLLFPFISEAHEKRRKENYDFCFPLVSFGCLQFGTVLLSIMVHCVLVRVLFQTPKFFLWREKNAQTENRLIRFLVVFFSRSIENLRKNIKNLSSKNLYFHHFRDGDCRC